MLWKNISARNILARCRLSKLLGISMKIQLRIFSVVFVLFASTVFAAPPSATQSEYLGTIGGGFMLSGGKPYYALTFRILKDLPQEHFIEATFDNPKRKEPSIVGAAKQEMIEGNLVVESPELECIKNKKVYEAQLRIYESEKKEILITEHFQKIKFQMPKQYIKQLGIQKC